MTKLRGAFAMAAAGLAAAQPCAAASPPGGWDERRASAFAGVNLRIALRGGERARPSARLQLATSYKVRDARTGSVETYTAQRLEIGASRQGAAFYMNGRKPAEIKKTLQLSGSTGDAVWIVFGVTLLAVGVLVLSKSSELPGPPV
jgi:hypothetical protein